MTQNDILLGIIGLIGTLVTAWAYIAKRRADARAKRIEAQSSADLARVQAESQTMIIEAQTKAREVDTHASQIADMMKLLAKQMEISTANAESDAQWRKRLEENEQNTNEGYGVIRAVQKETGAVLVELTNAVKELTKESKDARAVQQQQHKKLMEAITSVSSSVIDDNRDMMHTFSELIVEQWSGVGQQVGESVGRAMFQYLEHRDLRRELPPFPSPDDPNWKRQRIRPLKEGVRLQTHPHIDDGPNILVKSDAGAIAPEGEEVQIITGKWGAYSSVMKHGAWGYLLNTHFEVIEPTPEAA